MYSCLEKLAVMVIVRSALAPAALTLVLAACSRGPATTTAQSPAASPQPTAQRTASVAKRSQPAPAASPTQTASPSPAPSAAPNQSPAVKAQLAAKPAASPQPTSAVPRLPPEAAPQIVSVALSQTMVHPGDRVSGSVVTSSNVASVVARIGNYSLPLSKTGVGRFSITYTVVPLPWFVHGPFTLQVTARNSNGDAASRTIPITVR